MTTGRGKQRIRHIGLCVFMVWLIVSAVSPLEAVQPIQKKLRRPVVEDLGLLINGSFEEIHPGLKPALPSRWYLQRWGHEDTIALITDAAQAHRGQRFVRLYAPGVNAMRLHNQRGDGGMKMEPGRTYTIRAWARKQPGTSAMLTTEPGGKEFELSDQWKLYTTQYTHPQDSGTAMGMYLAVLGGPADVDDVSMVTAGADEPVASELRREWHSLKPLVFPDRWTQSQYASRLPVMVHETVGENAVNYPVNLSLRAIFRSFRLDFVRPEKIKVVDPRSGKVIPHTIISGGRNPNLCGDDLLMFLVDCPARARKTYYIYIRDFKVAAQRFTPRDRIPDAINVETDYAYRLTVNLGEQQARHTVSGRMSDGRLVLNLRGWTAETAAAVLVSPDGKRRLDVPLDAAASGHWTTAAGFRVAASLSPGIWQLEVTFDGGTAKAVSQSAAVLIGNGMWFTHNSERVYEDEPPRYGRGVADIAAAGNQWESFQVALASEKGLQDVSLRVTDLQRVNGVDRVAQTAITVDLVDQAYVIEGFRSGNTPDPLIPWQKENVAAAKQRVALVTVKVPTAQPAGTYSGELIAENAVGVVARLPIKLEIFGFSLPSTRSFTVIYAASFRFSPFGKEQARTADLHQKGRFQFERSYPSSENAYLAMLRLLGERHMTPFYYASTSGPFSIPWTYDQVKKTAELDFSKFDAALDLIESAKLDVKYVFINPENRIRHHGGTMYVYDEVKQEYLYGWHGTDMGRDMFYARVRPINEYLKKRGWSQRAVFYTNDEGFGEQTGPPHQGRDRNRLISQYSRMVHQVNPDFITFTADNANGNWPEPLRDTDVFAGLMRADNAEKFRQQGSEWWGLYNRMVLLTKPLTMSRAIGLDCYFRGWSHHFQLAMFYSPMNPWINPRRYNRAGDKNGFFVIGGDVGEGFSHMAYPWPTWREPLPNATPTLLSSLRLEAIRESIDDYEYVKMLADAAEKLPKGDALRSRCQALEKRISAFVTASNVGDDYRYGGAHGTFLFDGDELGVLLRQTARVISEVETQTKNTDQ